MRKILTAQRPKRFRVRGRKLGLRGSLDLTSVSAAIEQLDELSR